MISSALARLNSGVEGVCAFLNVNQAARELTSRFLVGLEPSVLEGYVEALREVAPPSTSWRIYDHCAAMSRIYALFEQFCESILADWIDFRVLNVAFNSLPAKLQDSYAAGFASILSDIHKVRFNHISSSDLIAEYHKALKGEIGYRLTSECLTHHKGNIRWDDINVMFERCGIPLLGEWVANHQSLAHHFQTKSKILEQTISRLSEFVQYRNDSAHALVEIDEILGHDEIVDLADFVMSFCLCLSDYVEKSSIEHLMSSGLATKIGVVAEIKRNNIVVCNVEGATVKMGDVIHLITSNSYGVRTVCGLMLNDVSTDKVVVANAVELGIKLDLPGVRRAHVISTYQEI